MTDPANTRIEALMSRSWPEGIPDGEWAIIAMLDRKGIEDAEFRLNAVLSWESEASSGVIRTLPTGMGRASFFEMLRRWRRSRSLESLLPRIRPHATWQKPNAKAIRIVDRLVESNPELSRRDLAVLATSRLDDPPALTTMEKIVDRRRSMAERAELGTDGSFGKLVVVEACPVELRMPRGQGAAIAWAGFVYDAGTTIMIAAAAEEDGLAAISTACRRALEKLGGRSTNAGTPPRVELHLPRLDERLVSGIDLRHSETLTVTSNGARSQKSRIRTLLDGRFGPLRLKPRLAVPAGGQATTAMPDHRLIDLRIHDPEDRSAERLGSMIESARTDVGSLREILEDIGRAITTLERGVDGWTGCASGALTSGGCLRKPEE